MIVLTSDYTNLTINGRLEAKLLQNAWELLFWYTLMSRQFKIDEVWISGAYSAPIPVRYVGYISGDLTSGRRWPDNMFISGGNSHFTSRFCAVVLGPITISKMVLEPLQDTLGHLLSGFRYRTTTIYVHASDVQP
ncbi:hypothetical protein MTR_6g033730 [Medicago truncatula]|uniref:Uncharacterized protein n=1 Tax=Medicago truncatula TaxID=3880 RepID=A0A072U7I1_MEDTR|nr:hypothetical protein MTR_6g033730 [Medicago truncatula]